MNTVSSLSKTALELKMDALPILVALIATGHYHKYCPNGTLPKLTYHPDDDETPYVVKHAIQLAEMLHMECDLGATSKV